MMQPFEKGRTLKAEGIANTKILRQKEVQYVEKQENSSMSIIQ